MNDIIRNGVILMVYYFVIFLLLIFISSPFEEIMSGFDNINGSTDGKVEEGTGLGRSAFNIMFALAGIIPAVWFIFWVFTREPDWGYR